MPYSLWYFVYIKVYQFSKRISLIEPEYADRIATSNIWLSSSSYFEDARAAWSWFLLAIWWEGSSHILHINTWLHNSIHELAELRRIPILNNFSYFAVCNPFWNANNWFGFLHNSFVWYCGMHYVFIVISLFFYQNKDIVCSSGQFLFWNDKCICPLLMIQHLWYSYSVAMMLLGIKPFQIWNMKIITEYFVKNALIIR